MKQAPQSRGAEHSVLTDQNSRWHFQGLSNTVIVFIHGLLSSSNTCWMNANGQFWPDLVMGDPVFQNSSVYLAGYHTSVDAGLYDAAQCAQEVFSSLRFDNGSSRAPMDYDRIILVAHSLGGVVARRMLEENAAAFSAKAVGLILMASPTLGSAYAAALTPLAKLYKNRTGLELIPEDRILEDLDHRFRRLLDEKKIPRLVGAEASEHHGPLKWKYLPWRSRQIVEVSSSSRYFGSPRIIANTDHFTIVKPESRNHLSHKFISNFYIEKFSGNSVQPSLAPIEYVLTESLQARVLFDVYHSQCREYCLRRTADRTFSELLAIASVWICGESGVGKSTIVKRYLDMQAFRPVELTLGHVAGELSDDRLLAELIQTINTIEQGRKRSTTFAEAVDALTEVRKKSEVVLFIDEVPLSELSTASAARLLKFFSGLIDAVKKKAGPGAQFVICSIDEPEIKAGGEKLVEQMHLLKLSSWSSDELLDLARAIESAIPTLQTQGLLNSALIGAASGSPRFLKSFYKRRLSVGQNETEAMSLEITAGDFEKNKVHS
ncbi:MULTISPECIES: alpha/beta fold hydrolase [unclassified Polaromonas]|uniref:alpha/beta fold hydrolase n=1 Tax=unclassified Polaromonas TaxID=2638319 RepID=UPI0013DDA433|nr:MULTISPECIES: alpha/beta fold hydrolase [unclassified Polaromonas]